LPQSIGIAFPLFLQLGKNIIIWEQAHYYDRSPSTSALLTWQTLNQLLSEMVDSRIEISSR
ncbi:MAG: hypothetical protein M3114_07525, partial [Thermoproteota archaeon]|nr:hypothetical protein [Thermoproteota archaeon]